ncbi:MAG: hypothetical protein AB1468_02000 [Candidatus Micrarchaeota archaeon]
MKNAKKNQFFIAKPCETGAAYDVSLIGAGEKKINLAGVSRKLRAGGFDVRVETPYLIVVARGRLEISFYRSGRLLVKGAKNEDEVRKIAREVYSLVA